MNAEQGWAGPRDQRDDQGHQDRKVAPEASPGVAAQAGAQSGEGTGGVPGGEPARVPGMGTGAGTPGGMGAGGMGGGGMWQGPPQGPPPGNPYMPGPVPHHLPQGTRPWWTARRRIAAAGAAMALALGAGGAGAVAAMELAGPRTVIGSPTAVSGVAQGSTIAQVAAAVQPSVVSIRTQSGAGTGGGSGVILRSDGVILTNAHVVENASRISVKFNDGRTGQATVLGTDTGGDVAVIKASGVSGLKPATLGDSGALAVGDTVLAVGSPLGLDGSVTSGIVSALGREIQEGGGDGGDSRLPPYLRDRVSQRQSTVIANAIQTDAAINPGNSGGALVNGAGQVIGINTAIATSGSGSGNIGVGFAIPINDARKAAESIIAAGAR
ncbi:S1C family serine protease [Actinomadura viridis]|uniref:S1C family serine protease n=1 Tax=Actinomadura viridis TaxID=58110 RepID=UPI0036C2A002